MDIFSQLLTCQRERETKQRRGTNNSFKQLPAAPLLARPARDSVQPPCPAPRRGQSRLLLPGLEGHSVPRAHRRPSGDALRATGTVPNEEKHRTPLVRCQDCFIFKSKEQLLGVTPKQAFDNHSSKLFISVGM